MPRVIPGPYPTAILGVEYQVGEIVIAHAQSGRPYRLVILRVTETGVTLLGTCDSLGESDETEFLLPAQGKRMNKRMPRRRKAALYIEGYRCGCSMGPLPRRELLGYCGKHGENRRELYKIPPAYTQEANPENSP